MALHGISALHIHHGMVGQQVPNVQCGDFPSCVIIWDGAGYFARP